MHLCNFLTNCSNTFDVAAPYNHFPKIASEGQKRTSIINTNQDSQRNDILLDSKTDISELCLDL